MDPESRKRVGESSSQRSLPKSRKRKSLPASPSPAPWRGAPKKKPRRRKEDESEKQFSLKDPGILDQKEENGKVYYLVNWADDPDTGKVYDPTWVGGVFYNDIELQLMCLCIGALQFRYAGRGRSLATQEITS
jgi:hypothetical protein